MQIKFEQLFMHPDGRIRPDRKELPVETKIGGAYIYVASLPPDGISTDPYDPTLMPDRRIQGLPKIVPNGHTIFVNTEVTGYGLKIKAKRKKKDAPSFPPDRTITNDEIYAQPLEVLIPEQDTSRFIRGSIIFEQPQVSSAHKTSDEPPSIFRQATYP